MSSRLFVGNIPNNLSENDLRDAFSQYGQVVNIDLKSKPGAENDSKFAFVSLSAGNYEVESCIKYFSSQTLDGQKLYVTRARESFLERLHRERQETQQKEKIEQIDSLPKVNPVLKLCEKLNPRKRQINDGNWNNNKLKVQNTESYANRNQSIQNNVSTEVTYPEKSKKKQDSDKKRMESLLKKRQEFKQKQQIIKTGLIGIDKVSNKKIIFSENEDENDTSTNTINAKISKLKNKKSLFEDDESDDNINFEIKKQFEGVQGQKVLDLQSKYKSDKRFILDERFVEDGPEEVEKTIMEDDTIDLGNADEKTKQLNILEDLLGVPLKTKTDKTENQKTKPKLGMLRFDPTQPAHAKFLAPIEEISKHEPIKKSKKKKNKQQVDGEQQTTEENSTSDNNTVKVEVSKEQFYKVSDTLKETLDQKTTFSLRSLFGQNETTEEGIAPKLQADYIPLQKTKTKIRNPLDTTTKNPFVYDSSDSETEEPDVSQKIEETPKTTVAVWKENLFFTDLDSRLKDGLAFFNKICENKVEKDRRELKSIMKKRLYNKQRKNQMFQKKIGGRKKSFKKTLKKG
ncbi:hypothetical protein ACJJTC_010924 [Scirpophaga incertulas]